MKENTALTANRIMLLDHYVLVLVGFMIALSALGFDLKNITILGGALGIGIGFGLQTVVSDFVCGPGRQLP